MTNYQLINLEQVLRRIGRGTVFVAVNGENQPVRWDREGPLNMIQLGDTEGEISLAPNEQIETLTLPEISGSSVHEAEYAGENPQVSIPLFLADPNLLPIVSPTGSPHAGHFRVRAPAERTIVLFPERLFRNVDGTYSTLSYNGGVWTLNGNPLTAAHQALLGMSVWLWRCYFTRPPRRFIGALGDAGKNIEVTTCQAMMHPLMPDGHRLYTSGNPQLSGIDIDPQGS